MSTGLTFGTISALFGLTNHIVDQTQYTILVTVVIGSAVVPTIIAQTFFRPGPEDVARFERLAFSRHAPRAANDAPTPARPAEASVSSPDSSG
jgi:hypothetical protein